MRLPCRTCGLWSREEQCRWCNKHDYLFWEIDATGIVIAVVFILMIAVIIARAM